MNFLEQLSAMLSGGAPAQPNMLINRQVAPQWPGQGLVTDLVDRFKAEDREKIDTRTLSMPPIDRTSPAERAAMDPRAFTQPQSAPSSSKFGGVPSLQQGAPYSLLLSEQPNGIATDVSSIGAQPADTPATPAPDGETTLEDIDVEGVPSVPIPPVRPAATQSASRAASVASPGLAGPSNGAAILAGFAPHGGPAQGGGIMNVRLRRGGNYGAGSLSSPSLAPAQVGALASGGGAPQPATGGPLSAIFGGEAGQARKEWLRNALLGLASGRNMNEGFRNAALMTAAGSEKSRERTEVNATRELAVKKYGLDPEVAKTLDGKGLAAFVINQQILKQKQALPDYEYREVNGQFGRFNKNDPTGSFQPVPGAPAKRAARPATAEDKAFWGIPQTDARPYVIDENTRISVLSGQGADNPNEAYGTPIYGTNANGEPIVGQLTRSGRLVQSQGPEGFRVSPNTGTIDTGTGTLIYDKRNPGSDIRNVPKDVAGEAAQKEVGKATGDARAGLGNALAQADQSIGLIDEMLKHPGRTTATGMSGYLDPRNYLAGTDAADFAARRLQLQGRAFLQAFDTLRGGGQITEVEGQKATDAIARLQTAQSDEAYAGALTELREVLVAGKRRAQVKASGASTGMGGAPAGDDPLGLR